MKEENKAENLQKFKEMLEKLPSQINFIQQFEVGINSAESPAAFDIVLNSTFNSFEELKQYSIHPDHLVVTDFAKIAVEDRKVVDFEG